MAVDWGLYGALRGRDDFAQKRADKQANLAYQQQYNQMQEKQVAEEAQSQAGISEYLSELSKMDVLPWDVERVKAKEQELRGSVIEGLKKANGDARKFLLTGGVGILNEYKNNLEFSDELKTAMYNKTNVAQWMKDSADGRISRPIIRDIDGSGQPKKITFEEQIALAKEGKIKDIQYNGSVEPLKIDPLKFAGVIKDPNNPYKSHEVTKQDYYTMAISGGAEPWQAAQSAQEYEDNQVKNGQPWHWGSLHWTMDDQYKAWKMKNGNESKQILGVIEEMTQPNEDSLDGASPVEFADIPAFGSAELKVLPYHIQQMKEFAAANGIEEIKGKDGSEPSYTLPINTEFNQRVATLGKGTYNSPIAYDAKSKEILDLGGANITKIQPEVYYARTQIKNKAGNLVTVTQPMIKAYVSGASTYGSSKSNMTSHYSLLPGSWAGGYEGWVYYPTKANISVSAKTGDKNLGVKNDQSIEALMQDEGL